MDELLYRIALTLVPGIGNVNGKSLIAYCGGAEAVFREKRNQLMRIPGIGEQTVNALVSCKVFDRAWEEIEFTRKYGIVPLYFLDGDYPSRLKQCTDGPIMLYFKGNATLNEMKIIAMVGTRSATEYGREMCRKVIEGLSSMKVMIVSGLAYGIDTWAHKAALEFNLPTVGVLGHSLDRIYPYANRSLAEKMVKSGGLISEFVSGTKPDRENFPMRNRIIAGISDAVLVVEAGNKGGALITADIANSYNRDVFAIPGRVGDVHSEGCNRLINSNRAALVQSSADIAEFLNWSDTATPLQQLQGRLFDDLSDEERAIAELLKMNGDTDIDTLMFRTSLMPNRAASLLLDLEFRGIVRCLPGKVYRLLQ